MALTIEEVRKIAALCRLDLGPEEEERFLLQLRSIVDYIDQLRAYEASAPAAGEPPGSEAVDAAQPCLPLDIVLGNAPESHGPFLVVPQVKGREDG